jgi:lipoyl(octanoyl) transferase
MRWAYLGLVPYGNALALQRRLRERVRSGAPATLLLLQHPAVITLGRSTKPENLLVRRDELARRGVALEQVERGGDVTYHGPGQLVGYPIRRIDRSVRAHAAAMADAMTALLAGLGIEGWWRDDCPGVWTEAGKIGAIGIDARGGVAMHGFALNLSTDLEAYQMIVPCGLQAPVTSAQAVLGHEIELGIEVLARQLAPDLAARYGEAAYEVSPEEVEQ